MTQLSFLHIASIAIHHGEEPVIGGEKGVCNIFFSGCNLQCIYCQNYQISRRCAHKSGMLAKDVLSKIDAILTLGVNTVGFVSPSHRVSEVEFLINSIRNRGFNPLFVYNTNGYDSVNTIKRFNGLIDIYIPDYKYASDLLAYELSGVKNYTKVALNAIKQMYYQKGNQVFLDDSDVAISGLIIRHLVLPNQVKNSINVLKIIAEELSPNVSISLMAQYNPIPELKNHPLLNRSISSEEYQQVIDAFYAFGFSKGWIQELESKDHYNPDFSNENPFKQC